MPEKSRGRRVQIAKRQGKATAIKSSDVGRAKNLSKHAAKKSSHVEGMRSVSERSVSRKKPPHAAKGRAEKQVRGFTEGAVPSVQQANLTPRGGRAAGMEHQRPVQRKLSPRSRAGAAAKTARKR